MEIGNYYFRFLVLLVHAIQAVHAMTQKTKICETNRQTDRQTDSQSQMYRQKDRLTHRLWTDVLLLSFSCTKT